MFHLVEGTSCVYSLEVLDVYLEAYGHDWHTLIFTGEKLLWKNGKYLFTAFCYLLSLFLLH